VPNYLAPGVYVEETSFRAPSIQGVGTSTAAFVGPTLTGPTSGIPELLTSFGDFESIFGGFDNLALVGNAADPKNTNYLALSVKGFFDNGGSELYISRVFAPKGADAGVARSGAPADGTVVVTSRFPGSFGNETVTVDLIATATKSVSGMPPGSVLAQAAAAGAGGGAGAGAGAGGGAGGGVAGFTFFTNGTTNTFSSGNTALASPVPDGVFLLTARVTTQGAAGQPAVYEGLGFDLNHPKYLGSVLGPNPPRHIDALQNQIAFVIGKNLDAVGLVKALFASMTGTPPTGTASFDLKNGNDGGEPASSDYDAALARVEGLEDVAIVAAPGSSIFNASKDIIASLITHVSKTRAYRVGILETPPNQLASDNQSVRSQIDSSYAALYVPWITTPNPLAHTGNSAPTEISVPPSGFMAGVWARSDEKHGVAKTPANEVVLGAVSLERNITFAEQGALNPRGINCIRYFPDRGYRVWGGRTVSSDPEFMYLNVRRYLIYLEHSIDNSTQWAVFENNGPALWSRVKEAIDSFLFNEFKEGNLLGDSPAEAYFVRCDRTTITQFDLDNGRMICLIGVAVLKPAEFVIFRIGQKTAGARS
jgi:phage tail sheath protein FI